MNNSRATVFAVLLSLAGGLLEAGEPMDPQKTPTKSDAAYREAMKRVSELKAGMSAQKVIALLGNPHSKNGNHWTYNFWEIAPPPQVGNQMIMGVTITIEAEAVAKIDYATLCATGYWRPPADKKPRKKAQ